MKGDLDLYQPAPLLPVSEPSDFSNVFDDIVPQITNRPSFPKGLVLLRRLFTAYPLRPVALNAQQQVPLPEGLDLDAWIVPPPKQPDDYHGEEKVKRKKKKGKGKENGHVKLKKHNDVAPPVEEDEAELAAVSAPFGITDYV